MKKHSACNSLTTNNDNIIPQKDYRFDNAKAFLIISVVLGHLLSTLSNCAGFDTTPTWIDTLYKSIYIFHMPVFMAISGRFAKRRIDNNDWLTVVKKLVIPYIIADTMLMLFMVAVNYNDINDFSYLKPMYGLWYLFNIAIYQLVSPYIVNYQYTFLFSLIIAFASCFFFNDLYGGFQRIITFYPFFLLGYYTSSYNFNFSRKNWFKKSSMLSFILLVVFVYVFYDYITNCSLLLNKVYSIANKTLNISKPGYLLILIVRYFLGFIFYYFTIGIVSMRKNIFTAIGSCSIYIYILHLFVIVFLRAIDKRFDFLGNINNNTQAIILCTMCIPLSFFLVSAPVKKITRWIVAPEIKL